MLKKTLLFISLIATGATNYLVSNFSDSILELRTDSNNTVKIGQEFVIRVDSVKMHPLVRARLRKKGTYDHDLKWNAELDRNYLELIHKATIEYPKGKNGNPMKGAKITIEYRFKALKPGTTTLFLEGDSSSALKATSYSITIEPDIPEVTPEQIELMPLDTKKRYYQQQKINAMTDQEIRDLNKELAPTSDRNPIKVSVGEEFIINQEVNFSTGKYLKLKFFDEQFLKNTPTTYAHYPISKRKPEDYLLMLPTKITYAVEGEGRIAQYHFQALKKGTTHVIIEYGEDVRVGMQEWEFEPYRSNTYTIEIE